MRAIVMVDKRKVSNTRRGVYLWNSVTVYDKAVVADAGTDNVYVDIHLWFS